MTLKQPIYKQVSACLVYRDSTFSVHRYDETILGAGEVIIAHVTKSWKALFGGDISDRAETVVIKTRHQRSGREGGLKGGGQRKFPALRVRGVFSAGTQAESPSAEKKLGGIPCPRWREITHTYTHTHSCVHACAWALFSHNHIHFSISLSDSNMSYYSVWISVRSLADTNIWRI